MGFPAHFCWGDLFHAGCGSQRPSFFCPDSNCELRTKMLQGLWMKVDSGAKAEASAFPSRLSLLHRSGRELCEDFLGFTAVSPQTPGILASEIRPTSPVRSSDIKNLHTLEEIGMAKTCRILLDKEARCLIKTILHLPLSKSQRFVVFAGLQLNSNCTQLLKNLFGRAGTMPSR